MFDRRPITVTLPTGKHYSVSGAAVPKRTSLPKRLASLTAPLSVRRKKRLAAAASSSSSSGSSGSSAPESESPEPMAIDLSSIGARAPFPWSPSISPPTSRAPPISRVPPELLSQIFSLGMDETAVDTTFPRALALSHVCAHWRHVAYGTSAIWATLHVRPSTDGRWLAHALALSHAHPLTLTLSAPNTALYNPHAHGALQGLVAQLTPHLGRVARMDVCTDDLHALETLLTPLLDGSAPALRALALRKPADAVYDIRAILPQSFLAGPPGLATFATTPALETLELDCIGLAWNSPILYGRTGARLTSLDLSHLTGPTLPALAYDDFRMILTAHPALERLVLRCTGPMLPSATIPGTPALYLAPIALPALQSLKISALARGPYVTELLSLLHTPTLATLELSELDFDGWAGFVESLRAHATDGARALHSAATGARLDGAVKYPHVTAFRLYNSCILTDIDDVFFRAFPVLEHLTLYCVEADPFVRVLQAEAFSPARLAAARVPRSGAFLVDASAGAQMSVAGSPAAQGSPPGWAPPFELAPEEADCIWPYLHTMSLRCMYNEKALRATVEARALIGRPIKTLRLEESLVSRLGDSTMNWLNERTKVEEFIYKGY